MEPVALSHLFLKILPTLAKHAGQIALRELDTSVAKAARATAGEFPFYPDLCRWLADWCASAEFFEVHAACTQGDRITADMVVGSFVKYVGKINPDHAQRCAEEVLPVFLLKLDTQELGSVGIAILDRRSEARHADAMAGQQEIRDVLATMSRQLSYVAPIPEADPTLKNPADALVNSKLDAAKTLLDGGLPQSARVILDAVREGASGTPVSDAMRFRLEALTGNYFLATGEPAQAVDAFDFAIRFKSTNARVRANLSTAKALLHKHEEALADAREAYAVGPTDGYVASVYLRRLLESEELSAAECFMGDHPDFLSDPYFMHAVAEADSAAGRRDEAIALLRPRLKSELAFMPAWELLGRTLLQRAQDRLRSEGILLWKIPKELLDDIREAEDAITTAIEIVEQTEVVGEIAGVFVNRAHARHLLGDMTGAESDYDRAIALEPDLNEAHHAKAQLALERSDHASVLREIGKIPIQDLTPEMKILLGLSYLALDRSREAIGVVDSLFSALEASRQLRIRAGEILVRAYKKLGDNSASLSVVTALEESLPGETDVLGVKAEHLEAFGAPEDAQRALEAAFQSAPAGRRSWAAIDLAAYYSRHQRWSEAVEVYREIAGPGMHPGLRLNYAVSLLNAGQIGAAYELAHRARIDEPFDPNLAEVEVRIMEHIGDVAGAIEVLTMLLQVSPEHAAEHRVRIATNLYRGGRKAEAADVLKRTDKTELAIEPELLMQAAKLRHWLNLGDSLDYAYRAWAANRGRPAIALHYLLLSLSMTQSDESALYPKTAAEGCRVTLRRGEELRAVDLVSKDDIELPPSRVRSSSLLGAKLVDAHLGDSIELGSDGEKYSVEQIISKYVAAHQDILRDFPFAFPGYSGLQKMEFDPNDPTPIFEALDARHDFVTSALRMYRERQMPIATLSTILRESTIDVWMGLTRSDPEERFLAANGTDPETRAEGAALSGATEIVIELTAILTAVRLDILPILSRRFSHIYVAQSVLDALIEAEAKSDDKFGPHGWMGRIGDRYVITDKVNEAFQVDRNAILSKAIEFITTQAIVAPCHEQLKFSMAEFDGLERTLGAEALASILLASERKLPLYCDDLALRGVARGQWAISGFWSQRLLLDCVGRGLLNANEYYAHMASLAREHYHFVQIDFQYLTRLIEKHHLTLAPEVMSGISLLSDPTCSVDSAVTVAANLVASCWTSPIPDHFRHLVLDAALGAVTQNRSPQIVMQAFAIRIRQVLGAQPAALQEIARTMTLWKRILFS